MPKWEDFHNELSLEETEHFGIAHVLRDGCSGYLLPLQICRNKEFYLPWKCKHEKHVYERCMFMDFKMRQRALYKAQYKEALEKRAAADDA